MNQAIYNLADKYKIQADPDDLNLFVQSIVDTCADVCIRQAVRYNEHGLEDQSFAVNQCAKFIIMKFDGVIYD